MNSKPAVLQLHCRTRYHLMLAICTATLSGIRIAHDASQALSSVFKHKHVLQGTSCLYVECATMH